MHYPNSLSAHNSPLSHAFKPRCDLFTTFMHELFHSNCNTDRCCKSRAEDADVSQCEDERVSEGEQHSTVNGLSDMGDGHNYSQNIPPT